MEHDALEENVSLRDCESFLGSPNLNTISAS
jgi:hypothetical protein